MSETKANLPPGDDVNDRVARALDPANGVPNPYVNGFACGIGSGDIVMVLERNAQAVTVVNMSYTVAKTLALSLSQLIANLETATERTMLTTHEMDAALAKGASRTDH